MNRQEEEERKKSLNRICNVYVYLSSKIGVLREKKKIEKRK